MRTVKTKLYKFDELSSEAKINALHKFEGVNVKNEWWGFVYYDAEQIGLKITGFDIDRGAYCKGEFIKSAASVAANIIKDHGKSCETYKTAKEFYNKCNAIMKQAEEESKDGDEDYWFSNEIDQSEDEFLQSLLEDYRIILTNEYEYLISEAAIIETIEANEYEFTEDGKLF